MNSMSMGSMTIDFMTVGSVNGFYDYGLSNCGFYDSGLHVHPCCVSITLLLLSPCLWWVLLLTEDTERSGPPLSFLGDILRSIPSLGLVLILASLCVVNLETTTKS